MPNKEPSVDEMINALGGDASKIQPSQTHYPGLEGVNLTELEKFMGQQGKPKPSDPFDWRDAAMTFVGNPALGIAKRSAKIADAPYRIATGEPPLPWMEPDPESAMQNLFDYGTEVASYFLPTEAEYQAGKFVNKFANKLPWLASYGAKVAGRGALGAGSNAFIARLNERDPKMAAMVGAAFNALPAAVFGRGEFMRDWARVNMLRALDPATKQEKAAALEIVDVLLDDWVHWARQKGLNKITKEHVEKYMQELDDFMAEFKAGGEPQVRFGDIESRTLLNAQKEFRPGWTGEGEPMGLTQLQRDAYDEVVNYLDDFVSRQAKGSGGSRALADLSDDEIRMMMRDPEQANRILSGEASATSRAGAEDLIDFSNVEASKRALQGEVAEKGGWLRNLVGSDLSNARDLAYRVVATSEKEVLEALAKAKTGTDKYKIINQALHDWLTVRDIGSGTGLREVGRTTPLAERLFTGFGMHFGPSLSWQIPGLFVRGARQMTGKPWYQTTVGNLKNQLAAPVSENVARPASRLGRLAVPTAERNAAIASGYAAEKYSEPYEYPELEPGTKVNIETGDVFTPEAEQPQTLQPGTKVNIGNGDRVWNPETQRLEPMR